MNRREFLRVGGALGAAAVVAPFIKYDHLMRLYVPQTEILTASEILTREHLRMTKCLLSGEMSTFQGFGWVEIKVKEISRNDPLARST